MRVEATTVSQPPARLVSALRDVTLTIVSDNPGDWDSTAWQRGKNDPTFLSRPPAVEKPSAGEPPKTSHQTVNSNAPSQDEFEGLLRDNRRRKLAVAPYIKGKGALTQPASAPAGSEEKLLPRYSRDLKIEIKPHPQYPQPGESVTFTITVMNDTGQKLRNVVIRFEPGEMLCYLHHRLPFNVLIKSGWVGCEVGERELRFSVDKTLRPGGKFVIEVTCAVKV